MSYVEVLCIEAIAERWIVHLGVFLPHGHRDHRQPNRSDNNKFRQVKDQEASVVLPETVIDAQPEHQQCREEAGLEKSVESAGQPRIDEEGKRKQWIYNENSVISTSSVQRRRLAIVEYEQWH